MKKHSSLKHLESSVKASADINRIRILGLLKKKKACVCEIAYIIGITQPSVSRHLKKLIRAGFIRRTQKGLWTDYYLCPENEYASNFIDLLDTCLVSEQIIKNDLKKLKKADRHKLCK
jgi:ArsR family transcriptional regulator, arsenate/arsenite/antimonite-responsive transcriptional repressor